MTSMHDHTAGDASGSGQLVPGPWAGDQPGDGQPKRGPQPGQPFTYGYLIMRDGGQLDTAATAARLPDSDLAAARFLGAMHKDNGKTMIYGHQTGRWLEWDGSVYRPQDAVFVSNAQNDVSYGALRLINPALRPESTLDRVEPLKEDLAAYAAHWRRDAARIEAAA